MGEFKGKNTLSEKFGKSLHLFDLIFNSYTKLSMQLTDVSPVPW